MIFDEDEQNLDTVGLVELNRMALSRRRRRMKGDVVVLLRMREVGQSIVVAQRVEVVLIREVLFVVGEEHIDLLLLNHGILTYLHYNECLIVQLTSVF